MNNSSCNINDFSIVGKSTKFASQNMRQAREGSDNTAISSKDMELIIEKLKCGHLRPSTKRNYLNVWRNFNLFLIRLDKKPKFWEDRTTLFAAYLVEIKKVQSSTLKSYVSAIKRTLIDDNYNWKDDKLILNTLTRACKASNDVVRVRLPIRCSLLEMMLFDIKKKLCAQPYLQALYCALFALGYYGMFRISELTQSPHVIKAKDIHMAINKEQLLVILFSSKTHGKGSLPQKVKITSNKAEKSGKYAHRHFCPMQLVHSYMHFRGPYSSDTDQFFVFSNNSPVKSTHARHVLQTTLSSLNIDNRYYGMHSL